MSSGSLSKAAALAAACVIALAGCAGPPEQAGQGSSPPASAGAPFPLPVPSSPAAQGAAPTSLPSSGSAIITVQPGAHHLIPATSDRIAAGVCGLAVGPVAVVFINPDTPGPRCQTVTASQSLEIVNHTGSFGFAGKTVTIRWAPYPTVSLDPGQAVMFSGEFGAYLAPGDHFVWISVYAGGGTEVYLRDATKTAGSP
ncbi:MULTISPECIES: hypothetical protein [Arthrobacter]|uniref:Lipoprotein n=1 Tax=Arthrobacter terricola TaxID=2547396 RepID=A0A4R5K923_9MICC|nr:MULTISPECIES: hypothetical protein [Arthrobacter]MBT8162952.1 hypothetical protein [Arthrobacter sp. GN70]TDF91641.1 hypothetical protein E1809_20175 [Arthrobacter terricola]